MSAMNFWWTHSIQSRSLHAPLKVTGEKFFLFFASDKDCNSPANEKEESGIEKNRYLQTDILIFKGLKNKVVSELRKAKSSYFMQLFADSHGNSSLIWKHMNK